MVLRRLVLDQWDFKAYKSALAVDQAPFYDRFSMSAVHVCASPPSSRLFRASKPLIDLAISSRIQRRPSLPRSIDPHIGIRESGRSLVNRRA
jgi:hypothetical protein